MKKKINIILILLFVVCFVGVTFAYYSYSETFNNNFDVGNFNVVIEEVFDEDACLGKSYKDDGTNCNKNNITKEVFVVNKETTGAIVRISYNEYFSALNGSEYPDVESLTNYSVIKNWTTSFLADWIYYDGWYYYKNVLSAGEEVQVLTDIESDDCCLTVVYNLDFNIEALQATEEAVKELWNEDIVINDDESILWPFDSTREGED